LAHYFEFKEADPRDKELKAAIKTGIVPEGCLLNGSLIMGVHYEGIDPCSQCAGPRERCGGRPMTQKKDNAIHKDANRLAHADDATYRALERKRKIGLLDRLMEKK
tara:strand:+ start:3071 stop:3388 length:318 start_codon:yes stop_codon:yes gene_type:complete